MDDVVDDVITFERIGSDHLIDSLSSSVRLREFFKSKVRKIWIRVLRFKDFGFQGDGELFRKGLGLGYFLCIYFFIHLCV